MLAPVSRGESPTYSTSTPSLAMPPGNTEVMGVGPAMQKFPFAPQGGCTPGIPAIVGMTVTPLPPISDRYRSPPTMVKELTPLATFGSALLATCEAAFVMRLMAQTWLAL